MHVGSDPAKVCEILELADFELTQLRDRLTEPTNRLEASLQGNMLFEDQGTVFGSRAPRYQPVGSKIPML